MVEEATAAVVAAAVAEVTLAAAVAATVVAEDTVAAVEVTGMCKYNRRGRFLCSHRFSQFFSSCADFHS